MNANRWLRLILVLMLPGLVFTMACAKQTIKQAEEPPVAESVVITEPAPEPEPAPAAATGTEEQPLAAAGSRFEGEPVYFEFDQDNLDAEARDVLMRKAEYLKQHPEVYVTVEGLCDERGTNAYNLALGERRAQSAKSYLVDLGIAAHRISTVSYGEERPLCMENSEACWAQNRRDAFVIN